MKTAPFKSTFALLDVMAGRAALGKRLAKSGPIRVRVEQMNNTFKILCRSNNEAAWTLYGVFTSEREFRAELANIRACGLQIRRVGL